MTAQHSTKNLIKAWQDLKDSFSDWRIFCMIGINDIRKRYARSRLGQFWLTLSLAINIASLGVVWSYLFKMPVKEYMPFLATSIVFWTFISTCINEGANLYIASTTYLKELNLPKLSYVNSLFARNIIVLLHNLIVLIPIYFFYSRMIPIKAIFLALAGFILTIAFLFPVIMFLSLVSLRFRDFSNITASLMQIVFYITPVMWKVNLMPSRFHQYFILNPFAVFLSICRDPLLSLELPNEYWLAAIGYTIVGWLVAFPFFSKFKSRITYWL